MDDLLLSALVANFALTSVGLTSFTYEMAGVPATDAYGATGYRGKDTEGVLQKRKPVR